MKKEYVQSLFDYIEKDDIYQKWKKGELQGVELSDFDYFCIKHCEDIEDLLYENAKLIELANNYEQEHKTVFKMWMDEIDKYKEGNYGKGKSRKSTRKDS